MRLCRIIVDPESSMEPVEPADPSVWVAWTMTVVYEVRKGFREICRRKIGPHEFVQDEEGSWLIRASDDDLAYVKLKYF
jgi:hypothetical protein